MTRYVMIFLFLIFTIALWAQNDGLIFEPDSGKRVDGKAMGGVYVSDSGTVYLYATYNQDTYLYISSDGLNFTEVNLNDYPDYRSLQLPDGRFVKFYVALVDSQAYLRAAYSTDGFTFMRDTTNLYMFPANDEINRDWLYHTAIYDTNGGLHYIYLAGNEDNARSIYSPPGDSFQFGEYRSNIFGDSALGRGATYVDPKGLLLPDGRLRVITMNQHGPPYPPAARSGTLYTFTSSDNGNTWVQDDGYRLRYDSFTEFDVYSLNDPKLVRLPDGRYRIYVAAMIKQSDGSMEYSILSATSTSTPTGIEKTSDVMPAAFRLENNWPNPFNPGTIIQYSVPATAPVELSIFDATGRKIRQLVNQVQAPGTYRVYWDGTDASGAVMPSGVYFYRLRSNGFMLTKQMVLLK